ncbi:MAG TPA: hypothetical protein VJZ25_07035 [Gemmatimonadaceae bacterium]|nr:hypothetical protein [Gemmatimonadaceae bacterium]
MKVRATRKGYFGERRRSEGELFEFPDDRTLPSWVEVVTEAVLAPSAPSSEDGPETLSEAAGVTKKKKKKT